MLMEEYLEEELSQSLYPFIDFHNRYLSQEQYISFCELKRVCMNFANEKMDKEYCSLVSNLIDPTEEVIESYESLIKNSRERNTFTEEYMPYTLLGNLLGIRKTKCFTILKDLKTHLLAEGFQHATY